LPWLPLASILVACVAPADVGGRTGPGGKADSIDAPEAWRPAPKAEHNLRIVTFNIRNFPEVEPSNPDADPPVSYLLATDWDALLDVLEALDFDLLAVQEIRDPAAFEEVLALLGDRTGATYTAAFTANENGNPQHLGLVVNDATLTMDAVEEHPELDLSGRLRPALSARVASVAEGGADFNVVVLHLAAGDSHRRVDLRLEQMALANDVTAALVETTGDSDVIVLGDLNTARGAEELAGLDEAVAPFGLLRQELPHGCSAYYVPNSSNPAVRPTWTDQVLVGDLLELDEEVPFVAGAHCAERLCERFESTDADTGSAFFDVSDHCPVYGELRNVDLDESVSELEP
jgi:endonuclease/exonuclease/phosphatase family metal-dependent hydrolase